MKDYAQWKTALPRIGKDLNDALQAAAGVPCEFVLVLVDGTTGLGDMVSNIEPGDMEAHLQAALTQLSSGAPMVQGHQRTDS